MPFEAEILLIVFNEATAPAGGGQWRIPMFSKDNFLYLSNWQNGCWPWIGDKAVDDVEVYCDLPKTEWRKKLFCYSIVGIVIYLFRAILVWLQQYWSQNKTLVSTEIFRDKNYKT